jgi:hypothetical protein
MVDNHSVFFNTSSFIVSWVKPVGYIDKYVVEVFCRVSTGYAHSVSLSSVQVSGVTPGDCCRLNVTAQGHLMGDGNKTILACSCLTKIKLAG